MILMDCNDLVLGSVLVILRDILNVIWVAGPLLAIVSLAINITTLVRDPDDKKAPKKIKNSILALAFLFFVPTIVNAAMYMLDDKTVISSCWTGDIQSLSPSTKYIDPNSGRKKNGMYDNRSDYEKGEKRQENTGGTSNYTDVPVTACGSLEYCNRFLTTMYNNSNRLSEAIAKYHPPVDYDWPKSAKTWGEAIAKAERGELVTTTCVVPSAWGMTDVVGKRTVLNSVGPGGFHGYKGPITQYTKQYKFDGSMSVKEAIQKGVIQPGDIIGVKAHTFSIYSVNPSDGSAVVFDGGHMFTNKCKSSRCSPMFTYSSKTNARMRVYQIVKWVK